MSGRLVPSGGRASGQSDPEPGEPRGEGQGRVVPLEALVEAGDGGWAVRLPVRAEQITVTKEAVVFEEVRIWRSSREETRQITVPVREERLRVDTAETG
jgi:stress response protein YsnF